MLQVLDSQDLHIALRLVIEVKVAPAKIAGAF
jgi:hypothetical protein